MKITLAHSWPQFQAEEAGQLMELREQLGKSDLHLHLHAGSNIDWKLVEEIRESTPSWKVNVYTDSFLQGYASKRGASEGVISGLSMVPRLYSVLLCHHLWHVLREEYVLLYDFSCKFPMASVHNALHRVPFGTAAESSDADKALMGRLVLKFGSWINDEYYSCGSDATGGCVAGLLNRELFATFGSREDFVQMLELFEYREPAGERWTDRRLLTQVQSFFGVLNRAFSGGKHELLRIDK